MSGIVPEMEGASEVTREQILNRLFEEETKKFHTEINAPHGMSTFDSAESLLRDEFGESLGDLVHSWGDNFRTNMVAHQRKRAKELVTALQNELAKEEANAFKTKLIGQLSK